MKVGDRVLVKAGAYPGIYGEVMDLDYDHGKAPGRTPPIAVALPWGRVRVKALCFYTADQLEVVPDDPEPSAA